MITKTVRLVAHGNASSFPSGNRTALGRHQRRRARQNDGGGGATIRLAVDGESGLPACPGGPVRRVPAPVQDLPGELRRGQHPADGRRPGPREPVPVRLDRLRRAVHHHGTAGDRPARQALRPAPGHRAHRRRADLHRRAGDRPAAGQGPGARSAGGRQDGHRAGDHARTAAWCRRLRAGLLRRPHRHGGPGHAHVAGPRPLLARRRRGRPRTAQALVPAGGRRDAARLGAHGRPARAGHRRLPGAGGRRTAAGHRLAGRHPERERAPPLAPRLRQSLA